jgi:hypothetical protein
MRAPRAAFWVYLAGVMLLGGVLGAYEQPFRAALGDWLSFAAVIFYLLLLRYIGTVVERRSRP